MEKRFEVLAEAAGFFNDRLFSGKLSTPVLTLQRKKGSYGSFQADGFEDKTTDETAHEISLNPEHFDREDKEILATLVHEQCHQWQQEFGNPGRATYHNSEWADQMDSIGLIASADGTPGGKRTGQKMHHYILKGGRFDEAVEAFLHNRSIDWKALVGQAAKRKPANKVKFTCLVCGQACWGKPELSVRCNQCDEVMLPDVLPGDVKKAA